MSDWRTTVAEKMVKTRVRRHGRNRRYPMLLHTPCAPEFLALASKAASELGLNRSAFVRRCISVQVARMLDLDVHDLLRYTPATHGLRHNAKGGWVGDYDHGEGIEAFQCPTCGK